MRRRRRVFPLPEAARQKRYKVVEGPGLCDNTSRTLYVPLSHHPRDRRIRAHEVAHAVISPLTPDAPKGIEKVAVQRAEDLRCNLFSTRKGLVDALSAPLLDDERGYERFCVDRLEALTAAVATVGTGDFEKLLAAAARVGGDEFAAELERVAETAWAEMDAIEEPEWDDTLRLAAALTELAREPESESEPGEGEDETDGGDAEGKETEGAPGDGESGESGAEDESKFGSGGDDPAPEGDDEGGEGDDEEGEGRGKGEGDEGDESESDESESDESDGSDGSDESETSDGDEAGASGSESGGGGGGGVDEALLPEGPPEGPRYRIELHDSETRPKPTEEEPAKHGDVEDAIQRMLETMAHYSGPMYENIETGTMKVVQKPRPRRLPKGIYGRTRVASPTGSALRHPNRFATDKAVFEERGRRVGAGTMIIDCSGSMSLCTRDVEELMKLAPASTIAAYSGAGTTGELWILAKDGRAVAPENIGPFHGGNVVDEPAVQWLAKQQAPRLWVCDGIVTGRSDRPSHDIAQECARIARRASIRRFNNVRELKAWLEESRNGRKRTGRAR